MNMGSTSETRARSITKTVMWRVIATVITLGTAYLFTGKISESLEIALVGAVISMTAYYFHERIWNKVRWGKT